MKHLKKTAIAMGVAQIALLASGAVMAQADATTDGAGVTTVLVQGQRAALDSAQKIKQNADEIVDSVVADDIGKLPDKSVTEVLQRVVGVTIDRTMNRVDPQQGVGDGIAHFAAEGTGVSIRGLGAGNVRSEFNGRDSFSANGGRSLSFEDVPAELLAGVDVYKNPSAEQIEGGIGGLVNLRTALPFDNKGRKVSFSTDTYRSSLRKQWSQPSLSGLFSDRWETAFGQVGVLVDLAHSQIKTESDSLSVNPYIPRTDLAGYGTGLHWVPPGIGWGTNTFERTRDGMYGALQWKKGPLASYVTYLRSKYAMHTGENGFFEGTNPKDVTLDPGATFDAQGALLTGTLRDPVNSGQAFGTGLGLGTDARASGRHSDTRDLSWHTTWRVNDQWNLSADLQHVRATTSGYDNTIGTGGWVPSETVDLSGSIPHVSFDQAARDYLVDPKNYYWGFVQVHADRAIAKMNTGRLDAKYSFDSPVLNDLRFGVRFTERSSLTESTPDGGAWTEVSQGWAVGNASWQPLAEFAGFKRFPGDVSTQSFKNFFGGTMPQPAPVLVPDLALVASPDGAAKVQTYHTALCQEANAKFGRTNDCSWSQPKFGLDTGLNEQHEHTQSAYGQLRFGFDKLPYPIDGNVGLRVIRTDPESVGYTLFTPPTKPLVPGVPDIPAASSKQTFEHVYVKALPSLNLRMKVGEDLQFRVGMSRGMSRPDFYQLQAYTNLSIDTVTHTDATTKQLVLDKIGFNGSLRGNTFLNPVMSNNFDVTAEYYFGKGKSVTMGVFNKRLKDIIIGQTTVYTLKDVNGKPYDFMVTGPTNGQDAKLTGVEMGFQTYFDKLPGNWSGLGAAGNFTYIDSSTSYHQPITGSWCTPAGSLQANTIRNLQGCDTDGRVFGNLPMSGMSKTSYNLALLYDKGPVSMRLAYSWRDKYLQSTNAYGTAGNDGIDQNPASPNKGNAYSVNYGLPTWGGAYGQFDLGVQYKITDNLRLAGQVGNLTNQVYKQYMQQAIGMKLRAAFYTGRSFGAQMNYAF